MAVIFVSLAAGLALMGSSRPVFALVGVGLILVLSVPFLLFAFVTTLLNHIRLDPMTSA
ncbi:regulator of phycobilisome association C [Synechococcus sp. BIOS-E4-1]|nr:regulator of phycobilisome association C [Synechococcus sp. BIOS-E4-1]QNI58738.1 regulator of phycobilisome association C [Synechococcus sp. BIOS-U3-1]